MKIYKLVKYLPFWNESSNVFSELHIEQLVTLNNGEWVEIPNKVEWKMPLQVATLSGTNDTAPLYFKIVDDENNDFYFYEKTLLEVKALKDGATYYTFSYVMDSYNTYKYHFKKQLESTNLPVKHIRKFMNRFGYEKDSNGEIVNINLNFVKQWYLGNTIDSENLNYERKFIYGLTADRMLALNYQTLPTNLSFEKYVRSGDVSPLIYSFSDLNALNWNNRYTYIVAQASALNTSQSPTKTKNQYVIIPVIEKDKDKIYEALTNFDIESPEKWEVNAFSLGNFVGSYDSDIPFSIWAMDGYKNGKVKLNYGTNTIKNDDNNKIKIPFFMVPNNYPLVFKLLGFYEYLKGMEGKIKTIASKLSTIDIDTEPYLLNPKYYFETYKLENDKFVNTDMSLIDFTIPVKADWYLTSLSLYVYGVFNTDFSLIYNYGEHNNTLNTTWNNNFSNLRNSLGLAIGQFAPSSQNYAANNMTTLYTANQNNKENNARDITNAVLDTTKEFANVGFNIFNPMKYVQGTITATINAAQRSMNTGLDITQRNREYTSSIQNIKSSPSTIISSPFLGSFLPNIVQDKDKTLFNTYSVELIEKDKYFILQEILNNGYLVNAFFNFNEYKNRTLMNVLFIDTSYNRPNLINSLIQTKTIFNSMVYVTEFLNWIANPLQFYSGNLLNCTAPKGDGYESNVELELPAIVRYKINIRTLFSKFISTIPAHPNSIITNLYYLNDKNINDDLFDLLTITKITKNKYVISVKENEKYEGFIFYDVHVCSAEVPIIAYDRVRKIFITSTSLTPLGNRNFANSNPFDIAIYTDDYCLFNQATNDSYKFEFINVDIGQSDKSITFNIHTLDNIYLNKYGINIVEYENIGMNHYGIYYESIWFRSNHTRNISIYSEFKNVKSMFYTNITSIPETLEGSINLFLVNKYYIEMESTIMINIDTTIGVSNFDVNFRSNKLKLLLQPKTSLNNLIKHISLSPNELVSGNVDVYFDNPGWFSDDDTRMFLNSAYYTNTPTTRPLVYLLDLDGPIINENFILGDNVTYKIVA